MFIFTTKLTKKHLIGAVVSFGALLCLIILLVASASDNMPANSASVPSTKGIRSNDDRIGFLNGFGWHVGANAVESQEVRIPEEFNEAMNTYNELQLSQGFDLTRHKGKRVKRFTYEILNHPTETTGVYADLLVYRNQVIGGDVHAARQDGFIAGLTLPSKESMLPDVTITAGDANDAGHASGAGKSEDVDADVDADWLPDQPQEMLDPYEIDEMVEAELGYAPVEVITPAPSNKKGNSEPSE